MNTPITSANVVVNNVINTVESNFIQPNPQQKTMMIATNIYKHMKTKILLLKSLRCSLSCFKDAISSFFCLIACLWDSMAFAIICCLKSPDVSSLRSDLKQYNQSDGQRNPLAASVFAYHIYKFAIIRIRQFIGYWIIATFNIAYIPWCAFLMR